MIADGMTYFLFKVGIHIGSSSIYSLAPTSIQLSLPFWVLRFQPLLLAILFASARDTGCCSDRLCLELKTVGYSYIAYACNFNYLFIGDYTSFTRWQEMRNDILCVKVFMYPAEV